MQQLSRSDFEAFISTFPTRILILDFSSKAIVFSNFNLIKELGFDESNIQSDSNTLIGLVHPNDYLMIESMRQNLSKKDEGKVSLSCEIRLKRFDDTWAWFSYTEGVFELGEDNELKRSIISLSPIQGLSQLESQLLDSEERFRTLAEASFGGIGIHDKGLLIEANQELSRMTGYEHHELIGMNGLNLIAPDQREMVMEKIVSGYELPYESVGIRKDGSTYALEIQGKQIPYKGKVVRVTEFRNIEERKAIEKAVSESETKYKDIVEFAVDGFLIGDQQGKVIMSNERILEILGKVREEIEGKHISSLFPNEVLEKKPLRFDLLKAGKTIVSEREILKPDGTLVSIEMHSKMMQDGTYQAIVRDVTKRKVAQSEIVDREERALKQRHAIAELATESLLTKPELREGFNKVTQVVANALGVSRTSIWLFNEDESKLQCITLYDSSSNSYSEGHELIPAHYPKYFKALQKGHSIYASDALSDSRTEELSDVYLKPLGITSLLDAGIIVSGKLEGVLCFEHTGEKRTWQVDEESFASNVASILAQSILVADRTKAEEALRMSEERLRFVIEATNDAIWDWDLVNNKTFFSDRFFTMLGYTPGEFEPNFDSWINLMHPNDSAFTRVFMKKFISERLLEFNLDFRLKAKDGSWRWIHTRGKIVEKNENGKPIRVVGTQMDITDRKLAEEEIKESRNLLLSVLDTIPVGVFWKDLDLKYLGCNKRFAVDSGFEKPSEIVGLTDFDLVWKEYANNYRSDDLGIIKTGFPKLNYEEQQVKSNGDSIWIRASKIPLRDFNGKTIGVLGAYDDITESKKVREQIELERIYFEQLFESAPEGIVVLDSEDRVIRCNQEFTRMFGYNQQEVINMPINSLIVPEDFKDEGMLLTNSVASGEVVKHETLRSKKDGTFVHVSILGKPIYFQGGKIAVYGIYRDISDRKRIEDELVQKNHEIESQNEEYRLINEELYFAKLKAEESDRLKSAFLANMSHEIRTPMNGILGFSQLLTNPDIPEVDVKQYVDVIQSCGNQLLGIINDLIDISKIEANQITVIDTDTNINEILSEQFLLFRSKAESKGIELSFSTMLPDNKSTIIADAGRLKQILTNLIGNAIKFTKDGSVKFGYRINDKHLEFFVEDTGIGIPHEFQEVVFERFRQVESALPEQLGGTGLGLAISKAFIQKMGGDIWVESNVGSGSKFIFILPYKPSKSIAANESSDDDLFQESGIDGANVLVAEDDDINFFFIHEMLSEFDVNIIRAISGDEAVEIVKSTPEVDIVLMDIRMPGLDGYQATQEVKSIRPDLPIIAQTAYAFSADKERALEVGCDDYISKPLDRKKLIALMSKYLEKSL